MQVINEQSIPYDKKLRLNKDEPFYVVVHISPDSSGAVIRGFMTDGRVLAVEVQGGRTIHNLPFCQPELYIHYHPELARFSIGQGDREKPLEEL